MHSLRAYFLFAVFSIFGQLGIFPKLSKSSEIEIHLHLLDNYVYHLLQNNYEDDPLKPPKKCQYLQLAP